MGKAIGIMLTAFNNDNYFLPGHFGNNAFPGQPINVTTTIRLKWR